MSKPQPAASAPRKRDPTPAEALLVASAKESAAARPSRVAIVAEVTGETLTLDGPHNDQAGVHASINETFGTTSNAYANRTISALANITSAGSPVTAEAVNSALALMGAIAPADELEAAIGVQIVAAHALSLQFLARAASAQNPQRAEAYVTMGTKLSRTVATQVESLAKLRSGGRQRIEVIYVNGPAVIGDNAQAVITHGSPGGGGSGGRNSPQSLAQLAALRGADAARDALQITQGSGQEALPDARRECGSSLRRGERSVSPRPANPRDGGGSPPASRGASPRGPGR